MAGASASPKPALALRAEPASGLVAARFDPARGVRQTIFDDDGNCLRAALATVTGQPLEAVVDVLDQAEPEERWFDRIQAWGEAHGWQIEVTEEAPEDLCVAVGVTDRRPGQTHAIVCVGSAPVFDPHPSDAMLSEVHHYIALCDSGRLPKGEAGTAECAASQSGGASRIAQMPVPHSHKEISISHHSEGK